MAPRLPRLALFALLFLVGNAFPSSAGASSFPLTTVSCGGPPISHSIRVKNDLPNCPTNGIFVGKSGITIDLNGHTIDGDGADTDNAVTEVGVKTTDHSNVSIVNGTVSGFEVGVDVIGGRANRVHNVKAKRNGDGITVNGIIAARDAVLSGNVASKNTGNGILAVHVPGVKVTGNVVSGNGDDGIELRDIGGPMNVTNNVAGGNAAAGILVDGATDGNVSNNDTSRNVGQGVGVGESKDVIVSGNQAAANGGTGVVASYSKRVTLRSNTAAGNSVDGIDVFAADHTNVVNNVVSSNEQGGISGFLSNHIHVLGNRAMGNRAVGIAVDGTDPVLSNNKAFGNGFGTRDNAGLGIDASWGTGVTTGTGNVARANDQGSQCSPDVACAPTVLRGGTNFPLTHVECLDVIETSIRLDNDIGPCPINGLIVNKSGVTLDLNGHSIIGNDSATHVGVFVGYVKKVTVVGGRISDFENGVDVEGTTGPVTVRNVNTYSNTKNGILINGANGAHVIGNTVWDNAETGISVQASNHVVIQRNIGVLNDEAIRIQDSGAARVANNVTTANQVGIRIDKSPTSVGTASERAEARAVIAGNQAQGNLYGIDLHEADFAQISKNDASANFFDGIYVLNSGATREVGNVASGNGNVIAGGNGIELEGNPGGFETATVIGNRASGNYVAGINMHNGQNTTYKMNKTHGNGLYGITETANATIVGNRASANGFATVDSFGLGIRAQTLTYPGGGNIARGNDDEAECGGLTAPGCR